MRRLAGLLPLLLAACAGPRWSGLQPVDGGEPGELRWTPLRPASPHEVDGVVYDLLIFDAAKGTRVYERRGLPDPLHRVEKPLGAGYAWTVRARYVRAGEPRRTSWTTLEGEDRNGDSGPGRIRAGIPFRVED